VAERGVIVLGAGPAGALAAGLLARAGVPTTLVTPGSPRGGVTLAQDAVAALDRGLGVGAELAAGGRPFTAHECVWGARSTPWRLPWSGVRVGGAAAVAALRAGAERAGATSVHGAVTGVLQQGPRVLGVRVGTEELEADLVIDGSGPAFVLARALGGTRQAPDRQLHSVTQRFEGSAPALRRLVSVPQGWLVMLPEDDGVAVGFVGGGAPPRDLGEMAASVGWVLGPAVGPPAHAHHAARVHPAQAGDGWFLVGHAGAFVDPVFGRSASFATRAAERAVEAILLGRTGGPPVLAAAADSANTQARREYRSWLRLARYWYRHNRAAPGAFWDEQASTTTDRSPTLVRAAAFLHHGVWADDPQGAVVPASDEQAMFRALGVEGPSPPRDEGAAAPRAPARWTRRDATGGTRVNLKGAGEAPGRRLELFVASGCNLHCAFCCESDRIQRKAFMPWEELENKLVAAAAAGIDVIQFMGGEATLHPRFPDALERAKQLGMSTYVITNLMRWQRRDFADAVAPWLDEIMISMHAGDAETGLEITGVQSWFRGFQAAAENARATLRARVRASTVLTLANADHLESIGETLLGFRPHAWVMGCAVPFERTRRPAADLNLSLTQLKALRPRFEALSARCAEVGCALVFFSMPQCVLGPSLWDQSHDLYLLGQDLTDAAPSTSGTATFWGLADDLPRARPVTLARTRTDRCVGCAREARCGGHFAEYFELHGAAELEPVDAR
jgi:flavin-dependent dehydrogenase/pyruvate-formate lyase-activating enzyme